MFWTWATVIPAAASAGCRRAIDAASNVTVTAGAPLLKSSVTIWLLPWTMTSIASTISIVPPRGASVRVTGAVTANCEFAKGSVRPSRGRGRSRSATGVPKSTVAVPVTPPALIGRVMEGGISPPATNAVSSWSFSSDSEIWTSMS